MNPLKLNKKTLREEIYFTPDVDYDELLDLDKAGFHDNTLALYPKRNSARIISQQGMFTLQGKSALALEEERGFRK